MTATVTNTGPVAGAEVVQVYVGDVESTVARPVRELKGFAKVALEPGESTRCQSSLGERAFAFWSALQFGRWAVEAGDFEISVGSSSSRDLPKLRRSTSMRQGLALPLTKDSTLQEWLADDKGRALLQSEHAETPLVKDPEFVTVVGSMPMSTLAGFPGMGVDHRTLDGLVARL